MYYGKGPDLTTLVALSTLASEQSEATEKTVSNMEWLLDYLATNPDAKIRYYKSDMILNIHSDASYLGGRYFKLKWNQTVCSFCVISQTMLRKFGH